MDDRRNRERVVPMPEPKGIFRLYVEQKCLDVMAVGDISPFGAKVELERLLDIDETVRLTYEYGDQNWSVSGSVMWSVTADGGTEKDRSSRPKKAGIYFEPEESEMNLEFFRVLTGMG